MYTLHIVSHTHWDREWFETYQQFRLKLVHLIDNLLNSLERHPDYRHFMLDGQTIVLEDYLEIRPEREEILRQYILEGRIQIGPWYILPDEFLVSAEAHIRNLIEGNRVIERFGQKMNIGYLPDTFGHIGQMPQILQLFEMDTACIWRGVDDLPCEFLWSAPDGTTVLAGFLRDSYSNAKSLPGVDKTSFLKELTRIKGGLIPHARSPHLLLMNGDDFMTVQPELGEAIRAVQDETEDEILHSTLPAYFEGIKETLSSSSLPVFRGELRSSKLSNLLPHVLSTRIWIKQRNQTCQTLLEKWTEPFSTWASIVANNDPNSSLIRHPAQAIRQAWRILLQCHPHDSICGCSIDPVHEEMRPRFDQVEQMGEALTLQSLNTLVDLIDTQATKDQIVSAVVVFNPSQSTRHDLVTASLEGLRISEAFELLDAQGNPQPYEIIGWKENELANVQLPPDEVSHFIGTIVSGEILGFRIIAMDVKQEKDQAFIEIVVKDHGQANIALWEKARPVIEELIADPRIRTFHMILRMPTLTHIVFNPKHIAGNGYSTFWVSKTIGKPKEQLQVKTQMDRLLPFHLREPQQEMDVFPLETELPEPGKGLKGSISNQFFNVELDADGQLNLLDKRTGTLFPGLNHFEDTGDRGDEYSYSPTEDKVVYKPLLRNVKVQRCDVWESIEIDLELTLPARVSPDRKIRSEEMVRIPIKTRATLLNGIPRLDIHTDLHNQAKDHRLRVLFPALLQAEQAFHDGHFEVVHRSVGPPVYDETWFETPRPEMPQQAYTAIHDTRAGLLVANRGLPEVEVLKTAQGHTEIALTLLRSVGWLSRGDFPERGGHAGPGMETPGAQMLGTWSFDYALIPFQASEKLAALHEAYAFQAPLRAISTGLHAGKLPAAGSFLRADPLDFVISAVKTSEDKSGWIVRGYNLSEQPMDVHLHSDLPFSCAIKINLVESKIGMVDMLNENTIQFPVKGKEIASIKFTA